jgi:membrane associated rhomboid family serine protease
MLWVIAGVVVGLIVTLGGQPTALLGNPMFLGFAGAYVVIIVAALVVSRYRLRHQGGTPPLVFESAKLVAPIGANGRRTVQIPYADIRSVIHLGKGWTGRVILDVGKRVMVYPTREFANPNAFEQLRELLKQRIEALPEGTPRWLAMDARASVADQLTRVPARWTYGFAAVLALIYACQWRNTPRDLLFGAVDWGANAATLVRRGQWFRLATANLLHANLMHVAFNLLSLIVLGVVVERQLGWRRYLLLLLGSGLLCQLASAFVGQQLTATLYSVGVSGIVFGVLGAQGVLNHRFGSQLPGGYRFPARVWWILLGVNFVALPLMMPQLDNAAHVGGLLSGAAITWWLCRDQTDITKPAALTALQTAVLGGLVLIWSASIAGAISHGTDQSTARADRAVLLQHVLESPRPEAPLDNEIAWALATQSETTPDDLDRALTLAQRAVRQATANSGGADKTTRAYTDTLATVQYRRGDFGAAVALEESVVHAPRPSYVYNSQYARFLQHYVAKNGVRVLGDATPTLPTLALLPSLMPATMVLKVTLPQALPRGAELTVLLLRKGQLLGPLHLEIGAAQAKVLKVTVQDTRLRGIDASDLAVWLAELNDRSCSCAAGTVAGSFFALAPEVARLP